MTTEAPAGVRITGAAQHEAWMARTSPPIEEVRPGLWSIPVPIPHNPLRYVSVYALASESGVVLVDAGWDSDDGWQALSAGLARMGSSPADVRGVLVTHLHPDHLGLAGRVREASGGWVAMHPADGDVVRGWSDQDVEELREAQVALLLRLGADRREAESDVGSAEHLTRVTRLTVPDRLVEDGDLVEFGDWSLRAVHTPGHTPGHLCFNEDRRGLFFAGDHVLPRITPNISAGQQSGPDPLSAYLSSLERVRDQPEEEVLPAHEWRFTGLAGRADQIIAHHERRALELLTALGEHPASTPWQVAGHLSWSRPWSSYERHMRTFAVTETEAHLRLLASRGLARCSDGPVPAWSAVRA